MSSEDSHDLIFKALADTGRRKILDFIKNGPVKTGDICKLFTDIDRCTVMQHLGVLEKAGLVIVRREGRYRWNYLNVLPIKEISERWISDYADHAVNFLDILKKDLEKD